MINLEDRPLTFFKQGERVRLVDDRGVAGFRKRNGITTGEEYQVRTCWRKHNAKKDKTKILLILEGYPDWVFSTRRFERVNYLPEGLFTI